MAAAMLESQDGGASEMDFKWGIKVLIQLVFV